jgi:MFS family permease
MSPGSSPLRDRGGGDHPLVGEAPRRHGRKRLLEVTLVLFLAASAICGAAQDITWLIVSRAVEGAAAGGLMTLALAAVGDLERRLLPVGDRLRSCP